MVLMQILLCVCAGLFQSVSWDDRHSPEWWEALEAVLGGRGLPSVFHSRESSVVGGQEPRLWHPAG